MSAIRERAAVHCPIGEAEVRVQSFFAQRRDPDGKSRLQLRLPIDKKGLLAGLSIEHDVAVCAELGKDDQNLNDVVRVSWRPAGGGAFPEFDGTICAWADHDPNVTYLEIEGTYQPPGGASGAVFDEAVGHAIARHTARVLLDDIARSMGERLKEKRT